MTTWLMRLAACAVWWAAAACGVMAARETSGGIGVLTFATGVLLMGSGIGLWRGSADAGPDLEAEAMRRSARRAEQGR